MVIDCHYHLEEKGFTVDELLREMDKCGIQKTALMGSMIEPFVEPPVFLIRILQFLLENSTLRWFWEGSKDIIENSGMTLISYRLFNHMNI
ncbi:MAG: hypothetical protein MZV70_51120 [Desulfobacterales bacterium]|nr:hypothetical protein [Desulfobacterales bacterium]